MSQEYKPVPKIPTSETKKSQVNQVDFTKYLSNEAKLKLGIKVESKKDLLIGAADLTLAADLKQEAETTNSNKLNLPIPTTELVAPTIGEKKDVGLTKMQAEANRNLAAAKARNEAILKKLNEKKAENAKLTPQPKASFEAAVAPQSKPEVTKAQATSTQHVETTIGGHELSVSKSSEHITAITNSAQFGEVTVASDLKVAKQAPELQKETNLLSKMREAAKMFGRGSEAPKTDSKTPAIPNNVTSQPANTPTTPQAPKTSHEASVKKETFAQRAVEFGKRFFVNGRESNTVIRGNGLNRITVDGGVISAEVRGNQLMVVNKSNADVEYNVLTEGANGELSYIVNAGDSQTFVTEGKIEVTSFNGIVVK